MNRISNINKIENLLDLPVESPVSEQGTHPGAEDVRLPRKGDLSAALLRRRETQRASVEGLARALQRKRQESPWCSNNSNEHVIL